MHDFMLAKQIADEIMKIVQEKKLEHVKSVEIEIGNVFLAHDGFPEHAEEISPENLEFGIKGIVQNSILKDSKFKIKRTQGSYWKIVNIEV